LYRPTKQHGVTSYKNTIFIPELFCSYVLHFVDLRPAIKDCICVPCPTVCLYWTGVSEQTMLIHLSDRVVVVEVRSAGEVGVREIILGFVIGVRRQQYCFHSSQYFTKSVDLKLQRNCVDSYKQNVRCVFPLLFSHLTFLLLSSVL
jgi:hypothetical protein